MISTIEAPSSNSIRNTFGIDHSDIISAFLQARFLSVEDITNGYIRESKDRQKRYILCMDYKAIQAHKANVDTKMLVSFQVRKDGCYAVTRIWKEQK